jgi:hypothetical protein
MRTIHLVASGLRARWVGGCSARRVRSCGRSGDAAGMYGGPADLAGVSAPEPCEVEPLRGRVLRRATVSNRQAVWSQHTEMAHDRLESAPVAGSANDRVGGYPRSVGEDDLATLETLDLRHDARAPRLEGLDEAVIDRGADELLRNFDS